MSAYRQRLQSSSDGSSYTFHYISDNFLGKTEILSLVEKHLALDFDLEEKFQCYFQDKSFFFWSK